MAHLIPWTTKNDANKVHRWGTRTFASSRKNKDFWPKNGQIWPKICIFGHFGPNIGIFGLFGPMVEQRTMRTRCLGGFSDMLVSKLLLPPTRIRTFGPKRPNLVKNMNFWSFWAKCWHFWPISSHAQPKNNANKVPRWVFRYAGYRTFDFSRKN